MGLIPRREIKLTADRARRRRNQEELFKQPRIPLRQCGAHGNEKLKLLKSI